MSALMVAAVMSSREIAELTGKRHPDVVRDIKNMLVQLEKDVSSFARIYFDAQNRQKSELLLDRELTEILITGYSIPLRAKVIRRLHELQAQQPDLSTDEGKLLLIQELASKQLAVIAENKQLAVERDEAIRTKAQISSRREAKAMATASVAARKVKKLESELGWGKEFATVTAVENVVGTKFPRNVYVTLRKWCEVNGTSAQSVPDKRYGKVKAWPAGAWLELHSIDLAELLQQKVT